VEQLRIAKDKGLSARSSLEQRRGMVRNAAVGLPPDMAYPRARAEQLTDRIQSAERQLKASDSAIADELVRRSVPVKVASWVLNHEVGDNLSLSLIFPLGVSPAQGNTRVLSVPAYLEARGEGAFAVGTGGFWCRSLFRYGQESLAELSDLAVSQNAELGFFGKNLLGVGFQWDWFRSGRPGVPAYSISALSFVFGTTGSGLGAERPVPLWVTSFSWELPRGQIMLLPSMLNLGVRTALRPSVWIRIEGDAAARTRPAALSVAPGTASAFAASATSPGAALDSEAWVGMAGVGFAFRLPVLKPFLWRFRWEGALTAPISGGEILASGRTARGVFRFGLEYTFF
jgi:hypothetical protein